MNPLTLSIPLEEVAVRLGAALLVGALLGLNRELKDKPAGLKTHSLVSLGAAMLTLMGISFVASAATPSGDPIARVVQGVITGIGFLGGGVILRDDSRHTVHGLTTAATIWLAACLGIACGAGHWGITLFATGAVLLVLLVGEPVERQVRKMSDLDEEPGRRTKSSDS